ncbi:MAG TPA: DNA polymerase I [Xanthobacteraceae bacterium]|nr:DNA polymerase I [Xanthobacteraceae bacterium]
MNDTAQTAARVRPLKKGDHVFLVDGSSYIFRAYFAMFKAAQQRGKSFTRSDGLPIGGVLTFSNMLWKMLREGLNGVKPSHLAVVFDYAAKSFRNDIYSDYKGHRPEPPDELIPQFPLMRDAVRAFGLIPIEQEGFEADDVIATYARLALEAGADVTIVAGDKDLMQLVRPGIQMFDPMPGRERPIGIEEVIEKFGVPPAKVPEVQALIGDSTDNVPGVPGIGVKTAAQLINEFGDLETLLARAAEIKQEKRRQSLTEFAEQARLSKRLVILDDHVTLTIPLERLCLDGASCLEGGEPKTLIAFLKAMEFTALTKRVSEQTGVNADTIAPDARLAAKGIAAPEEEILEPEAEIEHARTGDLFPAPPPPPRPSPAPSPGEALLLPEALVATRRAEAANAEVAHARYHVISLISGLDDWIAEARREGLLAMTLRTSSPDPMQAEIIGIAMAITPNHACYLPLGHRAADDLLAEGGLADGQIPAAEALSRVKSLLEDTSVLKVGHDIKKDVVTLARNGIALTPFDDVMLMSYVLDAGLGGHGIDELATRHLDHAPIAFQDVIGKGRNQVAFERVEIGRAGTYCAEAADLIVRLWRLFQPRLVAERMATVYATLERPLVPVLAGMERAGISIDPVILKRLSSDFAQVMARLEDEIYELADERFNLGSPKQLGDILFGKMGLPGASKTPTGAWSTRANVLEELAEEQGIEIARKILEWRQVSKLKSTYTDALPGYVNAETRRVHTSYALAATPTGRLSSSEPNLQNIPIRTAEGRKIRKAFIAAPGHKLVSADYSQIELRLLAEIADVPALREAFQEGTDIHAMTASEMFGVPVDGMVPEVRRRAKAINFGIIYGISAFGLANQLGIGREEAGAYIRKYFERFPGIRDYMEEAKAYCRAHGFVTTLFGRKVHYPDIKAKNPSLRAFNERAAINARLQGTAADIIRRAMIRMPDVLAEAKLSARMLLQVHDELVFEVPDEEVERTLPVVTRVMEYAPLPAVSLSVPLQVEARAAGNWDEAH